MKPEKWRTIELEKVGSEGYLIVPTDGSFARYASKSATELFETLEAALEALAGLVKRGVAEVDEVKIVRARLMQERRVEVIDQPVFVVVDNNNTATGAL